MTDLGMASWYGGVRDGHRTASGEIFDKTLLTACHRTLPFGTLVKVIDIASGRSVVVRINGRGVLSPDRIIDLSSAAADELGILRAGVAKVRLEVLHKVEHTATPQPEF
jgi:rare lipoprotein A